MIIHFMNTGIPNLLMGTRCCHEIRHFCSVPVQCNIMYAWLQ